MEQLTIQVKGSSADPYELTFIKDGASLTALCTCPAGNFGGSCKHRVAILDNDSDAVVEGDEEKVAVVVEWLAGTDVEAALHEMREASAAPDATRDSLAAAKKKLARAMNS
jgi:uncharacterized Zn finger protein